MALNLRIRESSIDHCVIVGLTKQHCLIGLRIHFEVLYLKN